MVRGHCEADRASGLEIDHQLMLGRCLHRQVAGFLPFEDAVNVRRCPQALLDRIEAIGNQAATCGIVTVRIDRRQTQPGSSANNLFAVAQIGRVRHDDETAVWFPRQCREGALDVGGIAHTGGVTVILSKVAAAILSKVAAALAECRNATLAVTFGFMRTAARRSSGAICLRTSSHFPPVAV
jgi:hypothetical protein